MSNTPLLTRGNGNMTTQDAIVLAANGSRGNDYGYMYYQACNDEFYGISGSLSADLASGIVPLVPTGITLDDETRKALAFVEAAERR